MAIAKTVSTIVSNQTIAASGNYISSGLDLSSCIDFGIGYSMAFHASATAGARIDLFADATGASSSFTVQAYDDVVDSAIIPVDAGHTVNGFITLNKTAKYTKIKVTNLDTGQSITAAYVYAHVQTA